MPLNTVLLIGAGFSFNWGAPLTGEVANSLLHAVAHDEYLGKLLTEHGKNFENALSQVQREYLAAPTNPVAKQRLDTLQSAIGSMFDRLNRIFEARTSFEFNNDRKFSVCEFLARFDAICGLNQDLLLELLTCPRIFGPSKS